VEGQVRGLNRRGLLVAGAFGTLAGCGPAALPDRGYSRKPWAAPRISAGNVIREVVGHRPFRPSGFVVRSEELDGKTLVHNYGHGGGGISLAWGSSALALRELGDRAPGSVAVIGSGIMGLTSARLLQDLGWQVTIYTRDVARHTTSNVAGGEWGPFGVHDPEVSTPEFKARLEWAGRISHHAYTNLTGADYGIRWLEQYALTREPREAETPGMWEDLFSYAAELAPGEHPFGDWYAHRDVTMQIDPGTLLRALIRDFQLAGGGFVIRNFSSPDEVLALAEPVLFNCTGLGAAELFGDDQLIPAKGQLVLLPPDPAVDYMTLGGGRGQLYMFPRTDVLLLGGTFKPGDYSTHPEPEETERIISEHVRLFSAFG
jgi:glycine/D-amino acid oxidase-like deaminating enzyme